MQRFKSMSLKKRCILRILLLLLLYLLYVIIGATIPFARSPKISENYKKHFDINKFFSDTTGVDRAAIVEDSQNALNVRLHMIEQAQESIIISSFSMKHDRSCQEISSTLYAAANRGVNIKIIVDGLTGDIDMDDDPMYYVLGTHPNIEIRYYNMLDLLRPWTVNGRLHDKYVIVDDKLLLLGGRNISNYFLGEYNTKVLSYDRDIFVYNSAFGTLDTSKSVILQVTDYFQKIWDSKESEQVFDSVSIFKKKKVNAAQENLISTYQILTDERASILAPIDYLAVTIPTNKITLITNPIHIMSKQPYILYELGELMKQAKQRVYIQTPYAVLNDDMYDLLSNITSRVPDCQMFLNSRAGGDNICASSDYTINRKKILKTGILLHEFQGDHSMHDKSILIDDHISVIGSYNLDMRSTYLDTEVMLVVDSKELNQQLDQCIQAMKAQSLPVQADGSYGANGNVTALPISTEKKALFRFLSIIFQPFRYLL